jgi:hypothetical protein
MKLTLTFEEDDWSAIQTGLHDSAGEIAASEARRTGGRSFASGGRLGRVQQLHRIYDTILSARVKLREEREARECQ